MVSRRLATRILGVLLLTATGPTAQAMSPVQAMYGMTPEQERAVQMAGRCSFLLLSVSKIAEKPAAEHVNTVGGFVGRNVIDPDVASNYEKVRADYVEHHEMAHCKDRGLPVSAEVENNHRFYLAEAYADSYSSLKIYQETGNLAALREFADLRAIGQLGLNLGSGQDGNTSWSRYHTAPVIDHTISWIEEQGAGLAGLDDDAIFALSKELTREAALTREQYDQMVDALPNVRVVADNCARQSYGIEWGPKVSPDTAIRIELALSRMAVRGADLAAFASAADAP